LDKDSDFIAILNLWNYFSESKQDMSWNQLRKVCQREFLNFNRMREWREIYGQLKRLMLEQKYQLNSQQADYDAVHKALMAGLVSQIGEKTSDGDYQSTRQNRFHIFPGSGLFQKRNKKQPLINNESTVKEKSSKANWLLAGELVETQKLYARQVAKIDPAWVETIAPILLKHQYSDPYWSRKASRAMVKESLTLYGLTVVANRPKPLAAHDAVLAHDLFIYHALVENDFITRAAAIVHNRKCLEQVEAMEHRARRRDILVEQDYLENFYKEKIPGTIHNGQAFERWYKKIDSSQQLAMQFSAEDLIRDEAEEIDRYAYPESLTVNNINLELEYHFEPGAMDDGLHIILPIAYINQLKNSDFDWLVPGMLKAKIIALIRGLPKIQRKNFVPVPDYAKALMERLILGEGTLIEQMASQLKQMSGVLIKPSDFNLDALDENLQPLFYLTDMDSGDVIATSRCFEQLKEAHADQALEFLNEDVKTELFQDYPDSGFKKSVRSTVGGAVIELFSGMTVVDNAVSLKTFDNELDAEKNTNQALNLLLIKKSSKMINEMKRHLPEFAKAELNYASLKKFDSVFFNQNQSGLYLDLFLLICDRKIAEKPCSFDSPELFEQLSSTISQSLLPDIVEHSNLLVEIFRQAELLRKKLLKLSSPALIHVAATIQERLETLMYQGFLSETGWQLLHHYPRFLKALVIRYERAEQNPQVERERSLIWDKWWDKYLSVMNKMQGVTGQTSALKDFRWLLEEFHVSLFAQQLGTKKSVSEKRLSQLLEQFY